MGLKKKTREDLNIPTYTKRIAATVTSHLAATKTLDMPRDKDAVYFHDHRSHTDRSAFSNISSLMFLEIL
jgi:hypothetical protein